MMIIRLPLIYLILLILFFVPAGTLDYWQAWQYMAIIVSSMILMIVYLLRNNPKLLERRMRLKERLTEQKKIILLGYIPFVLAYAMPGFDRRYGWSDVPVAIVIIADMFVISGLAIIFLVFRENAYASRIIEVEKDQSVITSGPYAVVRHPMYAASIFMYLFTPLALGSFWAVIPAMFMIPILIARIRNEEAVLLKDLRGYKKYMEKTRYRLIPGIW